MAPLTKEQRHEIALKSAKSRRDNKIAAEKRQQEQPINPPKEEGKKMYANDNPNRPRNLIGTGCGCLTFLLVVVLLLAWLIFWNPLGIQISRPAAEPSQTPVVNSTEAPIIATESSTAVPTEAPVVATEAPKVASTEAPVVIATKTPIVVILPTNPSLEGKLGTITQQGEDLDTILGKRITFTCRKIVVPNKAWNEVLSPEELKSVETTWVDFTISVPEGMFARIFAGGIRQGTNTYNEGILMNLKPGTYEFSLRNGEIVLWYPEQDKFEQNDLIRIFDQIRNGNFDIHSELAFFATTTDLLPKIPADLVQKNNVQIVPSLDPTIK